MNNLRLLSASTILFGVSLAVAADAPAPDRWKYDAELMRPFWDGDGVLGESVLFIKNPETGEAKATVLFPVKKIRSVAGSSDWRSPDGVAYEEGRDYVWSPGSREITLPADSRVPSFTPDELRRPAGSQRYKLTHRDGRGEIFFGAKDEYHRMQTCISYVHAPAEWPTHLPKFDDQALPRTLAKLRDNDPVSIVLIGDSISTGCNASGWADVPPFQPAFPELLVQHLEATYSAPVSLTNLSVGGTATPWALTRVPDLLAAQPDLVIVAFGMNDAAGRSAGEYKANIEALLGKIRESLPETEFILVASMLGNHDWTTLKHELFPQYRDALAELVEPGVALADLTSLWAEFLKRKHDWDLTGNGVNHPNDFGHRVYAQVLSTLLVPTSAPAEAANPLVLPLWNGPAPLGDGTFEQTAKAVLTVHRPAAPNGTAIIICPGGGYRTLVKGPEGHGIAEWLGGHGITGVVLEYRLPDGRPYVPLLDAQHAIRTVRANAQVWGLDPQRVGIMGFSAGGHLASTAATHFDGGDPDARNAIARQSCRPDFAILVYPVVTMDARTHAGSRRNLLGADPSQELVEMFSNEKRVTERTPPMFLAHAVDDKAVPPEHSRILLQALEAHEIPAKYVELPSGGHGLNGYKGPMWDAWQQQSLAWLEERNFVPARDEQ